MRYKSILRWSVMVFAAMAAFNLGAHAQKTDCSQKTEKDIVLAIYEKIKVKYASQIRNINLRFKDGTVTIEGWVTTKKISKDIEKMAKKTGCVKKVVNELAIGKSGGCGPGLKECGGGCIPEKETCNVCLVDPMAPGCYSGQEEKKP